MTADDGKRRRRKLSDDEHVLWRRVTRTIAPLKRKPVNAEPPDAEPRKPVAAPNAQIAVTQTHAPRGTPAPKPALAPLDRRQKRRLARGAEPIDARIDLHGRTQTQAHAALLRFLRRAQADGARYVLVITGKGRLSAGGLDAGDFPREAGVLRRQVPQWLGLPEFRAYVAGFEDAHIAHGGEGALYVRLRRG